MFFHHLAVFNGLSPKKHMPALTHHSVECRTRAGMWHVVMFCSLTAYGELAVREAGAREKVFQLAAVGASF